MIVAIASLGDAAVGLIRPKGWFAMITGVLKGRSSAFVLVILLGVFLVFAYFVKQQMTIIEIVPGIFLGAILIKMTLTAHPKEALPLIEAVSKKTDWVTVITDLALAGVIFWSLLVR